MRPTATGVPPPDRRRAPDSNNRRPRCRHRRGRFLAAPAKSLLVLLHDPGPRAGDSRRAGLGATASNAARASSPPILPRAITTAFATSSLRLTAGRDETPRSSGSGTTRSASTGTACDRPSIPRRSIAPTSGIVSGTLTRSKSARDPCRANRSIMAWDAASYPRFR